MVSSIATSIEKMRLAISASGKIMFHILCCIFFSDPKYLWSNESSFPYSRKTLKVIEILKIDHNICNDTLLVMASHIHCLCQALDLRVFENIFNKIMGTFLQKRLQTIWLAALQEVN
ncbi:phenylalanine ammonia-lyase [Puccinia sorghi]|uniref:Phenylalanine ammonia-lyase n=1 Tax=Puccinia sorghi TaxID=27349 RepID=A0A0L6UNV0_9BASI|nr:phenylalanine ammonia-lyase [Puccinia sorghi]